MSTAQRSVIAYFLRPHCGALAALCAVSLAAVGALLVWINWRIALVAIATGLPLDRTMALLSKRVSY